jgi:glutathione-independent formaldehyde dehydrogenase
VMNAHVVSLDSSIDAYRAFDKGSPEKFVIDPHNATKKITPVAAAAHA